MDKSSFTDHLVAVACTLKKQLRTQAEVTFHQKILFYVLQACYIERLGLYVSVSVSITQQSMLGTITKSACMTFRQLSPERDLVNKYIPVD